MSDEKNTPIVDLEVQKDNSYSSDNSSTKRFKRELELENSRFDHKYIFTCEGGEVDRRLLNFIMRGFVVIIVLIGSLLMLLYREPGRDAWIAFISGILTYYTTREVSQTKDRYKSEPSIEKK